MHPTAQTSRGGREGGRKGRVSTLLPQLTFISHQGVKQKGRREGGREGGKGRGRTNSSGVLRAGKHDLRGAIPPCHHVLGQIARFLFSYWADAAGEAKVTDFEVAVGVEEDVGGQGGEGGRGGVGG